MPLSIVRQDITKMKTDAIVNAANTALQRGGGVCGAIFEAAGERKLQEACDKLSPISTGEAVITPGFELAAKYIIHAAGPVYSRFHKAQSRKLLRSTYMESLKLAEEKGCESIAFPLISSGIYGYPKREALEVARLAIEEYLTDHDMQVYLVVFDRASFVVSEALLGKVKSYLDEHYVDECGRRERRVLKVEERSLALREEAELWEEDAVTPLQSVPEFMEPELAPVPESGRSVPGESGDFPEQPVPSPGQHVPLPAQSAPVPAQFGEQPPQSAFSPRQAASVPMQPAPASRAAMPMAVPKEFAGKQGIDDLLSNLDEPFSDALLRLIDAKGRTDVEVYKRANLDRKLFSKIRTGKGYTPKKPTILALAVSLELTLPETDKLLERAGYALSHASKFDVIVEYFIIHRKYNIFEINEVLFQYDQPLLGA